MKTLLSLVFTALFSLSAWAGDAVWFDVRSPGEFATGHVEQASNIPHSKISSELPKLVADKNQKIYLYCRSGKRAGIAKAALEKLGYTNVENLGGYQDAKAWLAKQAK